MHNLFKAIEDLISKRIGYGGSMGGYAAIKYSKLLGLSRVVSLVPQFSIDPEVVEDSRYNMFYHAELNANMQVQTQDIAANCEYIVVYDPYCAEDRAHFVKLEQVIPDIKVLNALLQDMMRLRYWQARSCLKIFNPRI